MYTWILIKCSTSLVCFLGSACLIILSLHDMMGCNWVVEKLKDKSTLHYYCVIVFASNCSLAMPGCKLNQHDMMGCNSKHES